jgi:hypothetical protein
LALCGSALAGDINSPPAPDSGDISDPPGATQSTDEQSADGLAEAALSLLNSVLALL